MREVVVDTAQAYHGTKEVGDNRGPAVEKFLASTGLGTGYPWCSAFVSYVLAHTPTRVPKVRSALAWDFVRKTPDSLHVEARTVLRGTSRVPTASLAVHKRGQTIKGHIGIVRVPWRGRCGKTIDGNTSPGQSGPQRDGQGVWKRKRCIHPGSYFRITHFVKVY